MHNHLNTVTNRTGPNIGAGFASTKSDESKQAADKKVGDLIDSTHQKHALPLPEAKGAPVHLTLLRALNDYPQWVDIIKVLCQRPDSVALLKLATGEYNKNLTRQLLDSAVIGVLLGYAPAPSGQDYLKGIFMKSTMHAITAEFLVGIYWGAHPSFKEDEAVLVGAMKQRLRTALNRIQPDCGRLDLDKAADVAKSTYACEHSARKFFLPNQIGGPDTRGPQLYYSEWKGKVLGSFMPVNPFTLRAALDQLPTVKFATQAPKTKSPSTSLPAPRTVSPTQASTVASLERPQSGGCVSYSMVCPEASEAKWRIIKIELGSCVTDATMLAASFNNGQLNVTLQIEYDHGLDIGGTMLMPDVAGAPRRRQSHVFSWDFGFPVSWMTRVVHLWEALYLCALEAPRSIGVDHALPETRSTHQRERGTKYVATGKFGSTSIATRGTAGGTAGGMPSEKEFDEALPLQLVSKVLFVQAELKEALAFTPPKFKTRLTPWQSQ